MRKISLDQYFTRKDDAKRFIDKLNSMYPLDRYDVVLEPSAGAGSFYDQLPSNRVGLDLEPMGEGIQKLDFFDYDPPLFSKIAVIGNPPFGRRGSLAKRFFAKCFTFADVIAFIVPAIFAKPSFNKSLDQYFHLEYEEFVDWFELPDGTPHKVKCVFQIWKKHPHKRDVVKKDKTHPDFEMVHRHIAWTDDSDLDALSKEYDFAYGQLSAKVADIATLTKGSQFIIKDTSSHGRVREIFETLNFEHLKKYAMGAVSLSREDVIEAYKKSLT